MTFSHFPCVSGELKLPEHSVPSHTAEGNLWQEDDPSNVIKRKVHQRNFFSVSGKGRMSLSLRIGLETACVTTGTCSEPK